MNKVEKIYRLRRNVLICAFVCSVLLFCVFCLPASILRASLWRISDELFSLIIRTAGVLAALMLLFLFIRYALFRTSTLKDPALRAAVDDERIRTGWLRAYRAAFYVIVGIHVVWLFFEGAVYSLGLPHAAWVSSTAGLMTFFSSAVYFTREVKHERS